MFEIKRIEGDSMLPLFRDGEYVLLLKTGRLLKALRPGDIVAFRQIAYGVMVKRINEVEAGSGLIHVQGDNLDYSTDSREFGPIHQSDIIGKVIWHIGRRSPKKSAA